MGDPVYHRVILSQSVQYYHGRYLSIPLYTLLPGSRLIMNSLLGLPAPVAAATYAAAPAIAAAPLAAATYAAAPAIAAAPVAAAPLAYAAQTVSAPAARDAVLTTIKLNPGHAVAYRVD